jgi:excisionase family DNA binding protein
MASLYRPKIVEYRLRDGSYRTPKGKRVTCKTRGAVKSSRPAKKWYGRYTDAAGRTHRVPLSESKEIARRMLAKLAGDAQLARVGIGDPFEAHRGRPLAEHVEDFRRYLAARGSTHDYCQKISSRVLAICNGCRFARMDDLQPSPVIEFLADLRSTAARMELPAKRLWYTVAEAAALLGITQQSLVRIVRQGGLSGPEPEGSPGWRQRLHRDTVAGLFQRQSHGVCVATSNGYLAAIKRFSKWLWKDRRTSVDPFVHLSGMNSDVDLRHARCALTENEFRSFLKSLVQKSFRDLTGADRRMLYTLAAHTGLRARELSSLEPANFDLQSHPPTVTVEACYSKHRRQDVQPLRADVARMVARYLAGKPRREPLWPGQWYRNAAEMIRMDLAAGIPYRDESGRVYDFHALRGQFISNLAAAGVHPKVAQILARHSTISLTMDRYSHMDVLDVTGALDSLLALPEGENPAATGKARARRMPVAT